MQWMLLVIECFFIGCEQVIEEGRYPQWINYEEDGRHCHISEPFGVGPTVDTGAHKLEVRRQVRAALDRVAVPNFHNR